jgi:ribosome-associated protein
MNNQERMLAIEKRLREAFKPLTLTVTDDSAKHLGHAGAKTGMGHFSVKIIAQAFQDQPLAERHRMIYTVLDDMMNKEIHALQIEAKPIESKDLIAFVESTLSAHKALDIKVLDVSSLTDVMDAMVICTATSTRHAASTADKLIVAAKKIGVKPFNSIENQTDTGWILVDLLDVVVHIMLAETREFYSLEKLWTVTEAARNSR